MRRETRERLTAQVADWRHLGLIDDQLAFTLRQRFEPPPQRGVAVGLLRALALFAALTLGSSVLGFVGVLMAELAPWLGIGALGAGSLFAGVLGARLAGAPLARHTFSGQVLLTCGLIGLYATLSLIYAQSGGSRYDEIYNRLLGATGLIAIAVAYAYGLRWPLLLGLLCLFHAIGASHGYLGHGGYFLDIVDNRVMALVGVMTAAGGVAHESLLEERATRRQVGFGHLYIIVGLLYLNLSLWLLSLDRGLAAVLLFTAAGIGQIVAGGALKDARFTGFGIVFLGIDLYTRLFEHFWNDAAKGGFLLLCGALGIGLGIALERLAQNREREET